ncbi:MAG TPA: trypsin-like peptidase domain-containing protein [Thermoanaerobaculia bacterium]|jgi:tetratricopeptide (TPR) repeat protein|nr:trypsin-like peptidase domain-containing protein [Thermoanaerobaculia bacterium]
MSIAEQIQQACDRFDRVLARKLAEDLAKDIRASGAVYPEEESRAALKPLRRKRYFDILIDLADAIFASGQNDALVRTYFAQATIEDGRPIAAIPYIQKLIAETEPGSHERFEAEGLLGRAYKELYVKDGRREDAEAAFKAYHDVFEKHPENTWHGINAVALHSRENSLPLGDGAAQRILDSMHKKIDDLEKSGWAYATAGEAAIALGDYTEARRLYEAYAAIPFNDAFEIASSLRQLRDVWKLDETKSPGREILPLLRGALLKREGAVVKLTPGELGHEQQAGLEKTFGAYGTQTMKWYQTGLQRCNGVCRIERSLDNRAWGTGFVVRGGDFHESLGDELLVLTNHHVINKDGEAPGIRAAEAQAFFEALSSAKYTFDPTLVWSSKALDATLLRFDKSVPKTEPFPMASQRPTRAKDQPPPPLPRVFIIGHPQGGGLSFSLVNNELHASDETRLHYLAPTERGSSGSPVFDELWSVVGLHHRGYDKMDNILDGGDPYPANEAYWIGAVRAACAKEGVTPAPPRPRSSRPSTRARKSSRRRT